MIVIIVRVIYEDVFRRLEYHTFLVCEYISPHMYKFTILLQYPLCPFLPLVVGKVNSKELKMFQYSQWAWEDLEQLSMLMIRHYIVDSI